MKTFRNTDIKGINDILFDVTVMEMHYLVDIQNQYNAMNVKMFDQKNLQFDFYLKQRI
jgi:hypothetical protein